MNTVQSFYERVEKINFPERLNKLDANVAGIMTAIESVQSRLDLWNEILPTVYGICRITRKKPVPPCKADWNNLKPLYKQQ
jgi:hypothetical protein